MEYEANTDVALTVVEAAAWFGVRPSTVREWARAGRLRYLGMRGPAKLYAFSSLVEADRATRNAPTQPGRKPRIGGS